MAKSTNYSAVEEIAGVHLGKAGGVGYKDLYDPSLLVGIPRHYNRVDYGIEESNLPFVGYDVWNGYEVSALTENGYPVTGMVKITCKSDSPKHVESKSIKLYLNSLNMTRLGKTKDDVSDTIVKTIKKDLEELLESEVTVTFFRESDTISQQATFNRREFINVEQLVDVDSLEFTSYKSDETQLEAIPGTEVQYYADFLRSNCRVTNQPDFGSVFIHLKGSAVPSAESIVKYIVSHRQVNHFHEEIAEMVYKHLLDRFNPEELMVACLYSRRGGLDINPIRANREDLIPSWFTDPRVRIKKELKQ